MTIKQYVEKQGNLDYNELPFNEIDGLIFSLLSYINFNGAMSKNKEVKATLSQVSNKFFKKNNVKDIKVVAPSFIRKVIELLQIMATTTRYKDLMLYNYVNEVEDDTQFGALSILLPDGTVFISFEGTDDSIAGWKEDCQLVYQFPVLAQQKATAYLKKSATLFGPKIRIGGHSKGGNLAMTSYILADFLTRSKVLSIYNYDGPGFRKKEFDSKSYQRMERKLEMYVPEESFVGMLLRHPLNYTVVKSSAKKFYQHDGMSWLVNENVFQQGKLSERSKKLEKRVFQWICSYDEEERKKMVISLFAVLERAGVKGLSELRITKINKIIALLKENQNMEKETRRFLLNAFKKLLLENQEQ